MTIFNFDNTCYYIHNYNPNYRQKKINKIIKSDNKTILNFT